MSDYARTIFRDLGVAIHIPGLMALVSIPVCLLAGETFMIGAFLIAALVAIAAGQALFRTFRDAGTMRVRHAMDTAALAWLTISFIGMLPFLLGAFWAPEGAQTATLLAFRHPLNALFESVSGFTSTGLSVSLKPEDLPAALVWWRSFMQWIGGVGVVVLMLSVFHPSGDAHRLYLAEAHEKTIMPDVVETVRTTWWLYLLLTAVAIVALNLSGMNWWHALNYGMTGIATGGFGATNGSIGDFGDGPRVVLMIIIALAAVSFANHYRIIVKGQLDVLWKEHESLLLFVLLALGAVAIVGEARLWGVELPALDLVFHWVSAMCTAGFQSDDLMTWSPTARLVLIMGMVVGGMAGSTTGGMKLNRIATLAVGAGQRIVRMMRQPWRLVEHQPLGDDKEAIRRRRTLEAASLLLVLWVVTMVLGSVVLLHVVDHGTPVDAALLEAASALGNVGLSSGITGPDLAWEGKVALIVMMWAGRLEIIPVLVLLASLRPALPTRNGKS